MNSTEIIIEAMKARGYNQTILAQLAGLKRQTNVSELLRSKSMRVDNFIKLLNCMGYDVIVKDKNAANKNKWVVNYDGDTNPQGKDALEAPIKKPLDKKPLDLDELLKPTEEEKPRGVTAKAGKIRLT